MKLKEYASEAVGLLGQGRESECQDVLRRGCKALYHDGHVEAADCLSDALQLLQAGVEVTAHEYLVGISGRQRSPIMTKREMREKLIEDAEYLDDLQSGAKMEKDHLLIIQARAHTVLAIMALGEWPAKKDKTDTPLVAPIRVKSLRPTLPPE